MRGLDPAKHFKKVKLRKHRRYVYVFESAGFYKIGIAFDVKKRLAAIQVYNPLPVVFVAKFESDQARWAENWIHRKLSKFVARGEWFHGSDVFRDALIKCVDKVCKTKVIIAIDGASIAIVGEKSGI